MRDGVRVLNVARGGLIDEAALSDALDTGKVAGAALDVFPSEPMTENPLFGYPNVVVTPHLGASTAEATDRAGFQSAEQIVAALDRRRRLDRRQHPRDRRRGHGGARAVPAAGHQLGRLAMAWPRAAPSSASRPAFFGRIADFDTRLLGLAVIVGALEGRTRSR